MDKQPSEKRFALLIDADNVSAKYIKPITDELSNYGTVTIKRIYGDWTLTLHAKWKDALLENSITPIQQFGYTQGKNATDSAMIIDAWTSSTPTTSTASASCPATRTSRAWPAVCARAGAWSSAWGRRRPPRPSGAPATCLPPLSCLCRTSATKRLKRQLGAKGLRGAGRGGHHHR